MHACMHACMHAYINIRIHIIYTHTYMYIRVYIHIHTNTYTYCVCVCVCLCVRFCVCVYYHQHPALLCARCGSKHGGGINPSNTSVLSATQSTRRACGHAYRHRGRVTAVAVCRRQARFIHAGICVDVMLVWVYGFYRSYRFLRFIQFPARYKKFGCACRIQTGCASTKARKHVCARA
jgi:hypothetical protein